MDLIVFQSSDLFSDQGLLLPDWALPVIDQQPSIAECIALPIPPDTPGEIEIPTGGIDPIPPWLLTSELPPDPIVKPELITDPCVLPPPPSCWLPPLPEEWIVVPVTLDELTGEELPAEAIAQPNSAPLETEIAALDSDGAISAKPIIIDCGLEQLPPENETSPFNDLDLHAIAIDLNDLTASLYYSETIGSDADFVDVEWHTEADDVYLDSTLPLLFNRSNPLLHWRAALSQSTVGEIQPITVTTASGDPLPVAETNTSSAAAPEPIGSDAFIPEASMVIAHRAVVAGHEPEEASQESSPEREPTRVASTADAVESLLLESGSSDGQTGTVLPFALSDTTITFDALWTPFKAARQRKH